MTKDEIIKTLRDMAKYPTVTLPRDCEALRMAADLLAQPEQEPVEVFLTDEHQMGFKVGVQSFILDYWPDLQSEVEFMKTQLLTAFARAKAPQRTWVGLTDEEIGDIAKNYALSNPTTPLHFARAIEAAHGIKGEA